MTIRPSRILPIAAILLAAANAFGQAESRTRLSLDADWSFALGEQAGAEKSDYATKPETWGRVDVPHDWSIEFPFDQNAPTGGAGGYVQAGIGWYRKTFPTTPAMAGKRITLQF